MIKETIGTATLYQGDCLEILPTLGKVDAVVTDPPYGLNEGARQNGNATKSKSPSKMALMNDYGDDDWDKLPCSPAKIEAMIAASKHQIIFGGNYFHLPPARCWLIWDKENSGGFADAEMAWTNLDKAVRLKRHMWNGMIRASENNTTRVHPTQKPIVIMEWCMGFIPDAKTILDPFMGSGTTGVACMNLGREFIGIELEPKYFDIACERITQAQAQGRLFE
jgi:DNA modification methylase